MFARKRDRVSELGQGFCFTDHRHVVTPDMDVAGNIASGETIMLVAPALSYRNGT